MATLKDYLGSLVKDLNQARMIADLETAAIAKMYAENKYLQHFSVPRMKILETELTIPIAVDEIQHYKEESIPIDNKKFYKIVYAELKNTLGVKSFSRDATTILNKEIYTQIDILEKEIKAGNDAEKSLDAFSNAVSSRSMEVIAKDSRAKIVLKKTLEKHKLNSNAFNELLKANIKKFTIDEIKPVDFAQKIENTQVTVESHKLKEIDAKNIVVIKLKITEESMEWQTMEDDEGKLDKKLITE